MLPYIFKYSEKIAVSNKNIMFYDKKDLVNKNLETKEIIVSRYLGKKTNISKHNLNFDTTRITKSIENQDEDSIIFGKTRLTNTIENSDTDEFFII